MAKHEEIPAPEVGPAVQPLGELALSAGLPAESAVDRAKEADSLPRARIVCLDLDDFLVDAGRQLHRTHLQVWRKRNPDAQEVPKEFADAAWKAIGGKGEEVFRRLWPGRTDDDCTDMLDDFRSIVRADEEPLEPLEGVLEGLTRLREAGMQLAIITNRGVKVLDILQGAGIAPDWFEFIFAQGEGHRPFDSKADALRQIAEETGVPLEEIVMGGDAIGDIKAGYDVGAQRLGIPRYGSTADELRSAGAHKVFKNFTEMVQWLLRYQQD